MKKVSIILINYKDTAYKDTVECLSSIGKLKLQGIELLIIVADIMSEEITRLNIKKFGEGFENKNIKFYLIESKENLGFSGSNNLGIKYALNQNSDYVLVLNNDTTVDPNLIEELIRIAEEDKKIGIVVPKIYFYKGMEFHKSRYEDKDLGRVIWYAGGIIDWQNVIAYHKGVDEVDEGQYDTISGTNFASGCAMLVKREVFEKIGLFDERYFLYYEDDDLSQKAIKEGYKIIFNPKAVIWHKNAASSGGSGSDLQDYYITRNRLIFGVKYAPIRSKLALFRESLGLLISGRTWQKKGVLDYYLRRFGKGSY